MSIHRLGPQLNFGGQCGVHGCEMPVTIITQGSDHDRRWCDTPGHARGLVLSKCYPRHDFPRPAINAPDWAVALLLSEMWTTREREGKSQVEFESE